MPNININIDLLILYKVHQSLSKCTHLTAFALIVYGKSTPVAQWYLLYLLRYWSLVQFPVATKLSQKNCVNYQLDNLLIKGVVGSTIKTWQPKNVGDDRQESFTIKRVTRGPLESYTGRQKLQNFFFEEDSLVSHMSIWTQTLAICSVIALADEALSSPVMTPRYLDAKTVRTPLSGFRVRQLPSSTTSDLAKLVIPPVAAEWSARAFLYMTMSPRDPTWTAVSSAKAEILAETFMSMMWPTKARWLT